ncbi:zinc-ribbon domain-containing protein [Siculibacillus lacustris]|nr:zinc-ribbon domain-containing protein [Siculibacillus lacustris]
MTDGGSRPATREVIMRAHCPTCDTGYTIPDDRIGPKGRKVRCTKCGDEWRVTLAEPDAAVPTPEPEPDFERPAPRAGAAPPAEPVAPPSAAARVEVDDLFGEPVTAASRDPEPAPPAPAAAPPLAAAAASPAFDAFDEPDEPTAPVHPAEPPRVRVKSKSKTSRLPRLKLPSIAWPDPSRLFARLSPFVGPLIFVSACLVIAGLVTFRGAIVAARPDLAGLYATLGLEVNLRGLAFDRISTLREIENGQTVLVVEGSVTNTTRDTRDVPALRFALRGGDSQELYAWSVEPKATALAAGDSIRFRTRLAAPPDQATDVQVRFVERRNLQAGLP